MKARWTNFEVSFKTNPINVGHGMPSKEESVVYWLGTTGKGRIRIS